MKKTFLIILLCIIAIFAFVSFLPTIVGFDSEDLSVECKSTSGHNPSHAERASYVKDLSDLWHKCTC